MTSFLCLKQDHKKFTNISILWKLVQVNLEMDFLQKEISKKVSLFFARKLLLVQSQVIWNLIWQSWWINVFCSRTIQTPRHVWQIKSLKKCVETENMLSKLSHFSTEKMLQTRFQSKASKTSEKPQPKLTKFRSPSTTHSKSWTKISSSLSPSRSESKDLFPLNFTQLAQKLLLGMVMTAFTWSQAWPIIPVSPTSNVNSSASIFSWEPIETFKSQKKYSSITVVSISR